MYKDTPYPLRLAAVLISIALVILGFGILLLVQGFFPKEKELIKEKIENLSPR